MGILKNIFSKIFPPSHPAVTQPVEGQVPGASQQSATPAATAPPPAAAPQSVAAEPVDVESILNDKARQMGQPLNWRTSIVDLLKLLGLDSSLQARKELARELHFAGDMDDTAEMNIWLHRQVMVKLAANGGKLPPDLRT
jgi:hypothetical protein